MIDIPFNSSSVFNTYSRYYDLLYHDKDYAKEASYIQSLLRQHGIVQGDLLEFGSGTGKHGCLLAKRGYSVYGIERSAEMVSQAEVTDGFTCQQGDIANTAMGRKFDAVLSLFHVISYQTTNEQLRAVFSNAASHLRVGGLFIFDFWYSPAVYAQHPQVRVKRMADDQVEITRISEPVIYPNENRVDVNFTIYARNLKTSEVQIMQETHPMRHFSLLELDLLSQISGFERVSTEEFLSGKQPGADTWGVCVILRKI